MRVCQRLFRLRPPTASSVGRERSHHRPSSLPPALLCYFSTSCLQVKYDRSAPLSFTKAFSYESRPGPPWSYPQTGAPVGGVPTSTPGSRTHLPCSAPGSQTAAYAHLAFGALHCFQDRVHVGRAVQASACRCRCSRRTTKCSSWRRVVHLRTAHALVPRPLPRRTL